MKRRSIGDLLKKLEEAHVTNDESISNLNDAISKRMLKGGYATNNFNCTFSSNMSCDNESCFGSSNLFCTNNFCLI